MPAKTFGTALPASLAPAQDSPMSVPYITSPPNHTRSMSHANNTPSRAEKRKSPSPGPVPPRRSPSIATGGLASPKSCNDPPIDTLQLRNDRLGTLVRDLVSSFSKSSSWENFVEEFRGRSYLSPELDNLDHPAASLLREWRDNGVPAKTTSPPWTLEQKDECIRRGCHQSATEHSDFLREEMAEFIENRFWTVLPYDLVRHLEEIMSSPAAIKNATENLDSFATTPGLGTGTR